MPLYEYECEKCGNRFEVIQKFADKPVAVHDDCGGSVRRLLSVPALKFKGSGFYINDYAKSSGGGASGSGSQNGKDQNGKPKETGGDKGKGDSGSSASSSPSKTDSAPAAATPASSTSGTK